MTALELDRATARFINASAFRREVFKKNGWLYFEAVRDTMRRQQADELREKVRGLVSDAELSRAPDATDQATDAIMALMEQVRADALEPSAANTLSIAITYAKPK